MLTVWYSWLQEPFTIHENPSDALSQLYWAAARARLQMWDWGTAAYIADDATRGMLAGKGDAKPLSCYPEAL